MISLTCGRVPRRAKKYCDSRCLYGIAEVPQRSSSHGRSVAKVNAAAPSPVRAAALGTELESSRPGRCPKRSAAGRSNADRTQAPGLVGLCNGCAMNRPGALRDYEGKIDVMRAAIVNLLAEARADSHHR